MTRRCEIETDRVFDSEVKPGHDTDHDREPGHENRDTESGPARHGAPQHAAERGGEEEHEHEQRHPACSDPVRENGLRGRVQRRHDVKPADAGDEREPEKRNPHPDEGDPDHRHAEEHGPDRRDLVERQATAKPPEGKRPDHGSRPESRQDPAVAGRGGAELLPRDQGKQRPQRARGEDEQCQPREHESHLWRVPRVTEAGPQGLDESLRGEAARLGLAPPSPHDDHHSEIRHRVEQERRADPGGRDQQAADRRPDGPGKVHPESDQVDRGGEVPGRHELREDGAPRRLHQGAARAHQEREHEQDERIRPTRQREQTEARRGEHQPYL